uniref:Partial AB-hydrolase lipase domain-containing protein n=1 Tax=Strigamia maritima TaxID=126957 RepID=T1IYD6_STRMM
MIRYHGYPVEVYQVETDDGYILTVQRIPHGKSGLGTQARKPVLIQHGFATSSPAWVVNTPPQNLPYILADVGYDVWLGNVRGSSFGYNHTHLSTKDKQFWQFSFDEMAKYDIPAVIQKMLNVTGFKQIHYIGHSMGTTILFALLSTQPKYNEIIKAGFALGPVISTRHSKGLLADAGIFYPEFHWLIDLLYNGQLKVNRIFIQFLARTLCNCPSRVLCEQLIFRITGPDYSQTNTTRYPVYFYHVPDSTSGQTMTHYYQLKYSKGFQYYDYGKAGNLKHYNTTEPPSYNLSRISAPVALFWSSNDYLADPKDVAALAPQLRNVPLIYRVPFDQFNHLDFMWAIDAKSLLYDKLITVMAKLWPNL